MSQKNESNFKTVGTKLSKPEAALVQQYCKRKGTSTSKLIREMLLKEIEISVPNNVAGKNIIDYKKKTDAFSWGVKLDDGEKSEIIENMSPEYLEELSENILKALTIRNALINKKKQSSVAVPTQLIK